MDLIHEAQRRSLPIKLLSTDFEKAFDRVNWPFTETTLRALVLGYKMLHWILILYTNLSAQVKVNGQLSLPFHISNGTRQGCPLSPLLFALTLEPFLRLVRLDPDVHGVDIPSLRKKLSAYFATTRLHPDSLTTL